MYWVVIVLLVGILVNQFIMEFSHRREFDEIENRLKELHDMLENK